MILGLAWRNLWRNKRRTILALLSVFGVTVLLSATPALQAGVYASQIRTMISLWIGHAQIQHAKYLDDPLLRHSFRPDAELLAELGGLAPAIVHAPRASAYALLNRPGRGRGARIIGVDPLAEARLSSLDDRLLEGRFLQGGAELLVGRKLAKALQIRIGDELTLLGADPEGSLAADRLTVVGIFNGLQADLDGGTALMPLQRFDETFAMHGRLTAIAISGDYRAAAAATRELRKALPDDLAIHDWRLLAPGVLDAILMDAGGGVFVYLLLLIMVTMTLVNSMLLSALERRREFGMVLALGMQHRLLMRTFWLENILTFLIGIGIGLLAAVTLTAWLSHHGIELTGMDEILSEVGLTSTLYPMLSAPVMLAGPALLLVFLALAALLPQRRIGRLEPVMAMRNR